jgi:acylphosphatase
MNDCANIIVHGVVQGVGFRYYVYEHARAHGLCGYVRNLPAGEVEIEVTGSRSLIDKLIDIVRIGPRFAEVEDLQVEWKSPPKNYTTFEIY